MKRGVHFIQENPEFGISLIPISRGFISEEEMEVLSDSAECAKIEIVRKQFKRRVLEKKAGIGERKSRDERPFVNKTQFILSRKQEPYGDSLLLDLLADKTTLFSRSYQVYATDHPVYLELRRQQGDTADTQLQHCLNEALVKVPSERKEHYEKLLRDIAEKAAQEQKSLLEIEQAMMDEAVGPSVSDRVLEEFIRQAEENLKADDVLNELNELFPDWELTQQETEYLCRSWLKMVGEHGAFQKYREVYTYDTPEGITKAENYLRNGFSELELQPEEAQTFISNVLRSFFCCVKSLSLEKEAAGHHTAHYFVYDRKACKAYLERKERLQKVLEQYQDWKKQDEMSAFQSLPSLLVDSAYCFAEEQKKSVPVGEIIKATKDYLLNTRGGAEHVSESLANTVVIETISSSGNTIAEFPILYLMVCVAGTSQLFSTPRVLTTQAFLDVLKSPYYQKPARWRQRIHRIDVLHKLHELCGLDRNQRSVSWQCFLQIHGSVIESAEEADLWRMIIYGGAKKIDFDNPEEDIPPIELSLLCSDCLQTCLPIQPERLYGYQGGSVLDMGGVALFLWKYADVLPACVQRIKQRPERWKNIQKQYLKQWSMVPCNLLEIKEQCRQGSALIRWGTIPNASQEELRGFCQSLHKGDVDEKRIASDTEELKMLLTEAALRVVVNEQARQVLADIIEEVWSKDSDFKFRVSFLKRSKTEER